MIVRDQEVVERYLNVCMLSIERPAMARCSRSATAFNFESCTSWSENLRLAFAKGWRPCSASVSCFPENLRTLRSDLDQADRRACVTIGHDDDDRLCVPGGGQAVQNEVR